MQVVVKGILRATALILHLFQTVISISGEIYISAIIGAMLFGVFIYDFQTIKRLFYMKPLVISLAGSFIWFIVAVIEFSYQA